MCGGKSDAEMRRHVRDRSIHPSIHRGRGRGPKSPIDLTSESEDWERCTTNITNVYGGAKNFCKGTRHIAPGFPSHEKQPFLGSGESRFSKISQAWHFHSPRISLLTFAGA